MPRTLLDLANELDAKNAKLKIAASQAAIDTALTVVGSLAYSTPVDTSQALSSWFVTLESPSENVGTAYYPGSQGSTRNASAAETLNAAKAALSAKKPGQTIYIANNQPYIKILDAGTHSKQPGGFVARAMLLAGNFLRNYKLKW